MYTYKNRKRIDFDTPKDFALDHYYGSDSVYYLELETVRKMGYDDYNDLLIEWGGLDQDDVADGVIDYDTQCECDQYVWDNIKQSDCYDLMVRDGCELYNDIDEGSFHTNIKDVELWDLWDLTDDEWCEVTEGYEYVDIHIEGRLIDIIHFMANNTRCVRYCVSDFIYDLDKYENSLTTAAKCYFYPSEYGLGWEIL